MLIVHVPHRPSRDEHQAIAAMLRSVSMRLHHAKETQLLFPLVRRRCPELAAVIDRLE